MIAAALAGCAANSDPTCDAPIAQGVVGVVTYTSDVGNQPSMPVADHEVMIGGVSTTSDADGRFAVELAPGDYMTTGAAENVMVHVDPGKLARVDLHLGFGTWWSTPARCN